ncbi:MAG: hypothetical protein ACYTGQ_06640, partial [Planctomycetota bacterium]
MGPYEEIDSPGMNIFLSVTVDTNLIPPQTEVGGCRFESHERVWLGDTSRLRAYLHYLREGFQIFRASRKHDALLLCTANVQL